MGQNAKKRVNPLLNYAGTSTSTVIGWEICPPVYTLTRLLVVGI